MWEVAGSMERIVQTGIKNGNSANRSRKSQIQILPHAKIPFRETGLRKKERGVNTSGLYRGQEDSLNQNVLC